MMNHWAHMLAELPTVAQRLIARTQRISLPRGATAATRVVRLRQALCHAATVRTVYFGLDPTTQEALQMLRSMRGGIRPDDLAARYGPVRPWRQLAADPAPQTVAERLLLLGWLLPRPPAPRHPPRYLLPPELRRWLPQPLHIADSGPLQDEPLTPALLLGLRAATTILLTCAEQPLLLRADRSLRRTGLRLLAARLAPLAFAEVVALVAFLLPLLDELGTVSRHLGRCTLTIVGQRFLALAPNEQLNRLRMTWLGRPDADTWLAPLRIDPRGIDWPLLRWRLVAWGTALPYGCRLPTDARYARLAAAFGPLADAQTHGFRRVDRAPWQPRRAAAVFQAALDGPLAWLGYVGRPPHDCAQAGPTTDQPMAVEDGGRPLPRTPLPGRLPPTSAYCWQTTEPSNQHPAPSLARLTTCQDNDMCGWRYGGPGEVLIPHQSDGSATLRLLPFARWQAVDNVASTFQISRATLAGAAGHGYDASPLWALLEQHAGPPPAAWRDGLAEPVAGARLVSGVVLDAPPAVLERASRQRSVRRYLRTRLAPGVALVAPEHAMPLVRALARANMSVTGMERIMTAARPLSMAPPHRAGRRDDEVTLAPGECAALLLACAVYRTHAPPDAPLLVDPHVEQRLRSALTPPLHTALDAALDELRIRSPQRIAVEEVTGARDSSIAPTPAAPASTTTGAASGARRSLTPDPLPALERALAERRPVEITYNTKGRGVCSRRSVRPLHLEQRDDVWYLHAYCTARQAERTFRVDRIGSVRRE